MVTKCTFKITSSRLFIDFTINVCEMSKPKGNLVKKKTKDNLSMSHYNDVSYLFTDYNTSQQNKNHLF